MIEDTLKECTYKPMPTPPDIVIQYARKKSANLDLEMKEGYWREKRDVVAWFQQIDTWRATNLSNCKWLNLIVKDRLVDSDAVIAQCKSMIAKFEEHEEWSVWGKRFMREIAGMSVSNPGREVA